MRSRPALLSIFALAFFLVSDALAQSPPPREDAEWISLDGQSEPGTPARVVALEGDADFTSVEVRIPGFWVVERIGPDQRTYQEVFFPGLGQIAQPGAPKLPAVQLRLALPSEQVEVQLAEVQAEYVPVGGIDLVYPQPVPERDFQFGDFDLEDEDGAPAQFLLDEEIYAFQGPWPPEDGTRQVLGSVGRAIPEAECLLYPCKFDPAEGALLVSPVFRATFAHQGGVGSREPITLERERIAGLRYLNWELVAEFFPVNPLTFEADYLFVYRAELRDALLPLINQKKARGYLVTELQLEDVGSFCSDIRLAIRDWYESRPVNRDKYCLLVGDTDDIPQCESPMELYTSDVPTDDSYASTNGVDLDEEIYLGRLSVDGATDLEAQVAKLLNYMDGRLLFTNFAEVGLVAHKENAPGKYVGAHESVRLATYSTPPSFNTFYGDDSSVGDADVSGFIDEGVGLVAYRGHGNASAWTGWNTSNEYYDLSDVSGLANAPETPVIWSFACTNANLDTEDCIGERWLETSDAAVAHYGASVPSYTTPNHELDRAMFRAVYDYGLTKHAQAIETAEAEMAAAHYNDNAWMYNLLGDPDMDIRRAPPRSWTLFFPEVIDPACPDCPYEFGVIDEFGNPVENVLVSVLQIQAGSSRRAGDFQDNRYTDDSGAAALPLDGLVDGELRVVFRSLEGEVYNETIPVRSGATSAPTASDVSFRLSASPSVTDRATVFQFGAALHAAQTVTVYDVRGRTVRELRADAGTAALTWDGRDQDGRAVGSGVYLAKAVVAGQVLSTRVTVVR